MKGREDISFPPLDGLTLRGWLYSASQKGLGIIMKPGTIINDVAEYYFNSGFTVLSYDPRSIGARDGTPRNEYNPVKNMEDYMDALTFLKSHEMRHKAVITTAPLTIWEFKKWKQVLSKCMKDRESRLAGNKPVNLPMLTENGEQPAGIGENFEGESVQDIITRSVEMQPNFISETALSSYYHIAAFQPFGLIPFVSPTPAMVTYREHDGISPILLQREMVYDVLKKPKQDSERVLDEQIAFLHRSRAAKK
ncbi:DltD N-terminal domain protein [Talaromyces pinophilus]|uniref:DltD N-terminal domain protein n=1 Tax=Talaromyces pinophilus TaxID=128442 RepID=A0A6V8H2Q4_TALPI|nr:DltD N-terminal domain protein [Talaromyces pinophilus]